MVQNFLEEYIFEMKYNTVCSGGALLPYPPDMDTMYGGVLVPHTYIFFFIIFQFPHFEV